MRKAESGFEAMLEDVVFFNLTKYKKDISLTTERTKMGGEIEIRSDL